MKQNQNFQRRDFLKTATTGIIAATGAGAVFSCSSVVDKNNYPDDIVQKVKTAMLSMQRASWEQGVVAYTIYRGIKSGWLAKTYLEKAEKMRLAAHSKVDEHGFVQGVCGAPTFNSSAVLPKDRHFLF